MLFVNLSQAPLIISCTILLLLLIGGAILRQNYIKAKLFSKNQQAHLLSIQIKGIKIAKQICLLLITVFLGISLLDPRGSSLSSDLELEGIDLVLVYDISRSMDVEDSNAPNQLESRLRFAKKLGVQLLDSLVGNRVGLVAYAADAIRLLPLTTDLSSVELFVNELSSDMISSQSTDIGKALDEAVKNFQTDTLTHKSIVLFTDGENLDGSVEQALGIIQQQGISVFVVGVGTEEGGLIPIRDANGSVSYYRNLLGQNITSKLDTTFLQNLANQSQGTYLYGSRATINELITLIDSIAKSPFGTNTQSYLEPKFRIFILGALLALLLYLFLPETKRRRFSILILLFLLQAPMYSLTPERNAYSSYQNGEYSTALRYFQRSLIQNPQNEKSRYGEGATLYKLERGERAANAFLSLTNSPDSEIAQKSLFNVGNARLQAKDFDGALEIFKQVLKDNPPDSRLYNKALNNYVYTRALQQQQQQQQQQDQQNQEGDPQDNQDSQDNQNQQGQQDQQQDQNGNPQDSQNQQNQQNQQGQQGQQPQDQSPSQSVSPSDIDNLLGVAEREEKENLSRQFSNNTQGIFNQNKY